MKVYLICFLVLIVDCLTMWSLLLAFYLKLPLYSGILLWIFFAASSILPSTPGFVGVYQIAAILALDIFNIPPSIALAYSTIYQGLTLTTLLILLILMLLDNSQGSLSVPQGLRILKAKIISTYSQPQ